MKSTAFQICKTIKFFAPALPLDISKTVLEEALPHKLLVSFALNPSSLKPFSQTYNYSLKGGRGFIGPLLKIFVMCGLIDLRFGINVNWTLNFHLVLIT